MKSQKSVSYRLVTPKLVCVFVMLCTSVLGFTQYSPYNDWLANHKYANEKKPGKLKPLADAGDADAAFQLGYGYCMGQYDEADKFVNLQKHPKVPHCDLALPWLAKAAQRGYSQAYGESEIGLMLSHEYEDDAKFWLLRALKDGNPGASYFIQSHHLKLTPLEQAAVNGDQAAADAAYNAAAQNWQSQQGQGSRAAQIINGITGAVSAAVPAQPVQAGSTPIQDALTNGLNQTNHIQAQSAADTASRQQQNNNTPPQNRTSAEWDTLTATGSISARYLTAHCATAAITPQAASGALHTMQPSAKAMPAPSRSRKGSR